MIKKYLLLFIGLVFITILFVRDIFKEKQINDIGLVKLNLQLEGIVDSIDDVEGFNNCGIVFLTVLKSNITDLLSHNTKYYYCIIKNDKAEIFTECDLGMKGSRLTLDTKNKLISYTDNGIPQTGSISINTSQQYQNYIRKHSILLNKY